MQNAGRKCFGGFIALAIIYILITGITVTLNKGSVKAGVVENDEWVATSKSWFDRQLCKWIELCGTAHLNSNNWIQDGIKDDIPPPPNPTPTPDLAEAWLSGTDDPDSWDDAERERRDIPQYVLDYAPYVHLFSREAFWPCDLMDHLHHTSPYLNYSEILDLPYDTNLTNLDELNDYNGAVHGRFMYLQSEDNVEERPDWLGGEKNIPEAPKADHPFPDEDDDDIAWPDPDDVLSDDDMLSNDQQQQIAAPVTAPQGATRGASPLPTLAPSPNGRCGGGSGFTCTGSRYGKCCSIYGWCGSGEDYCGEPCEALAGKCNNPFEPRPRPKVDLRRRRIIPSSASSTSKSSSLPSATPRPSNSTVGRSSAPAILIVVKKPDGIVDAFWFFFYSYNLGQKVFNIRFGNHVGDWEHTMLRFKNGKPQSVFLSEHDFGAAYKYSALEKYLPDPEASPPGSTFLGTWSNSSAATSREAKRPVVYSAVGSHAMYATPGIHPYILPWGLLHDQTDRGPLWDPSLNFQSYVYNTTTRTASSSLLTPLAPNQWFDFAGHWGDKFYPLSDPRQYRLAGQYHYVNGPVGPKFKNLGRKSVCQVAAGDVRGERKCRVKGWVGRDEYGRRKFRAGAPWEVEDEEEEVDDGVGAPGWSDLDGGLEGNRPGQGVEEGGLPGGNVTDDAVIVVGAGGRG